MQCADLKERWIRSNDFYSNRSRQRYEMLLQLIYTRDNQIELRKLSEFDFLTKTLLWGILCEKSYRNSLQDIEM